MAPKVREGVKGAPTEQTAAAGATDAVCGLVLECSPIPNSKHCKLSIDVGREAALTIVTNWDVSTGMRVIIAVVGSFVNEVEVREVVHASGATSEGLLCDGQMLGWEGATPLTPALLPSTFAPGDSAPSERPRRALKTEEPAFAGFDKVDDDGPTALFEAKLSKDEKKALAAKKKAERAAKKSGDAPPADAGEEGAAAPAKPRVKPTKADLKKIKKATADKRKAGEDVATDDELEAAGFLLEGEEE